LGHLKLPHSSVSWRSWAVSSSSTRWWWWSWVVSAGWGGGYAWWFLVGDMSWAKLPCCGGLSLISRQVSDFWTLMDLCIGLLCIGPWPLGISPGPVSIHKINSLNKMLSQRWQKEWKPNHYDKRIEKTQTATFYKFTIPGFH
jgi:hypothetical protein